MATAFLVDLALVFFNTKIVWFFIFKVIGRSMPLYYSWRQRWLIPLIFFLFLAIQNSWARAFKQSLSQQFLSLCRISGYALVASVLYVFLTEGFLYSRSIIFSYFLLAPATLIIGRWLLYLVHRPLLNRGWGLKRSLVLGTGPESQRVIDHLILNKAIGYDLVGCLAEDQGDLDFRYRGVRAVGRISEAEESLDRLAVDQIFIPGLIQELDRYRPLIELCQRRSIELRLVSHQVDILLRAAHIWEVAGVSLISREPSGMGRWGVAAKRAMDIVVSLTALVILSPLMALICLLIAADSPGGILYRQRRVGQGGRLFQMLKFRTMAIGSETAQADLASHSQVDGPIFKMKNDPRVTRVGAWLRRFSLDELPQLINVLCGDMSLVGPRPGRPEEVEKYSPWHHRRYQVPQGMTGLWQVSGRSELNFEEMVLLDIYYAENWSLFLDLEILLRTIPVIFMGRGAY